MSVADSRLIPSRNEFGKIRTVFEEPLQSACKFRYLRKQFGFENLDCEERNEADDRPDFDRMYPIGVLYHIVVELIFRIPETDSTVAHVVHRFGDIEKVFEEFCRQILIYVIVSRKFERDSHQIEAEHRHPTRSVGLVDSSVSRQRRTPIENADIVETEESALKDI